MFLQILSHTPTWVFLLFLALLALGLAQLQPRRITVRRATTLPLIMGALSGAATVQTFPALPLAWLCWLAAMALVMALMLGRALPAGTAFLAREQRLTVPGSAAPLALMMGLFFTKYAVGVALGLQPQLAEASGLACAISAAYGVFSGAFLARGWRLWRLCRATATPRVSRVDQSPGRA